MTASVSVADFVSGLTASGTVAQSPGRQLFPKNLQAD
jgi:hypothetical protein